MRNEDLKITDNDKMRLHYRKRSGKSNPNKFDPPPTHNQIDLQNATDSEKDKYSDIFENDASDGKFYAGAKKPSGKIVMIDPVFEKRRKNAARIDKIAVYSMLTVVIIILISITISYIADSSAGQKLMDALDSKNHITEQGNYVFGSFDGYVTIGTSFDEAVDILGLPTPGGEGQYFYGNSYILIEDDIVVGYHKDRSDHFLVTVGYKDAGANAVISLGDSAKRVVAKLGSPETYHKYQWTYTDMNQNFLKNSYYSSNAFNLVVSFNEKYEVIGYEFIQQ